MSSGPRGSWQDSCTSLIRNRSPLGPQVSLTRNRLPRDVEAFTVSGEKFEPCLNGSKTGSLKILIHRQRCAAKLAACIIMKKKGEQNNHNSKARETPHREGRKKKGGGEEGGERGFSLIRKHDHFMPSREIEQHVRALAHNHPEGGGAARLSRGGLIFGPPRNSSAVYLVSHLQSVGSRERRCGLNTKQQSTKAP